MATPNKIDADTNISVTEPTPHPAETNPYLPAPLDLRSQSIRLLEILPTSGSDTIRCRLRSYPISVDCPRYIALSYMWDHNLDALIEINDTRFPIGRNLWCFLQRMHLQQEFGPFWIDAICINQSSTLEKNHQVSLMGQIYRGAESVSIWLGEHIEGTWTDMAMKYLKRLPPSEEDLYGYRDSLLLQSNRLKTALWMFCQHHYWTRIWIVQEILLAKSAAICSGSIKVDLHILHTILKPTPPDQGSFAFHLRKTPCFRVTIFYGMSNYLPLSIMFNYCIEQKATILVDKVYALVGLAREQEFIVVDYCKTPKELFQDLVVLLWCSHRCDRWPNAHFFTDETWHDQLIERIAKGLMLEYDPDAAAQLVAKHCALESCPIRKH